MTEVEQTDPGLQVKRRRLELARLWLSMAAAVLSAAALVVSVVLLVQLGDVAQANRTNGQVVRDCVEPTGKCYQRNAERTEQTLTRLSDLMIAVELCGQRYFNDADARACVRHALQPPR